MAYTLQQLSDLEDIRTLKHRYFRGIDTADLDLLSGLFTADLVVDYRGGTYRVSLEGRDNMIEFLANSFHSSAVAMHHGHMPEITLTGDDTAEGIWYLEDIFINLMDNTKTIGSAIYVDQMVRTKDGWKIYETEYDRVIEVVCPLAANEKITENYLATRGLKKNERTDISHLITWS